MRCHAIRHHDFAHDEHTVGAGRIGIDGNRLQHAVRAAAFSLHRRRTIEAPERELFERRETIEFLDLRLATQVRYRGVPIEPNILELILCHVVLIVMPLLRGRRTDWAAWLQVFPFRPNSLTGETKRVRLGRSASWQAPRTGGCH